MKSFGSEGIGQADARRFGAAGADTAAVHSQNSRYQDHDCENEPSAALETLERYGAKMVV